MIFCVADCGYMPNVNCSDTNTTMKYYYNSTTQMCQQIMVCDNLTCLFNSSEECNQECPGVYMSTASICVYVCTSV